MYKGNGTLVAALQRREIKSIYLFIIVPVCRYVTEERGLVEMKGKGSVTTYWLVSATDKVPIKKKPVQPMALKPFFRTPKNLNPATAATSNNHTPEVCIIPDRLF